MCIKRIKLLYSELKSINDGERQIYEIDTQIFLIEPVLKLAGWNLYDPNTIKRASRNSRGHEFDIELYKNDCLKVAVECKALGSTEFNIDQLGTCGRLNDGFYNATNGDGIGQIRGYCQRYNHFIKEQSLAILTNGFEWIIFKNSIFLDDLHSPLTDTVIQQRATIEDAEFEEKIIKTIAS